MDPAARYAHELQIVWLGLVSMKEDRKAAVLSPIIDLIFANQPEKAIQLAEKRGLDRRIIGRIREAFSLTD